VKLVLLKDFKFQNYDGPTSEPGAPEHATLTCVNHQFLRWSTKNPYQRSIHYLGIDQYVDYIEGRVEELHIPTEHAKYMWTECECPFAELRVIVEEY
jgi:hypothetical protein